MSDVEQSQPEAPSGWIACSERMPPADEVVIGWGETLPRALLGRWNTPVDTGSAPCWTFGPYHYRSLSEVSHWMPLPAAPGVAPPPAAPQAEAPSQFARGIDAAARFVEKRLADYDAEHGSTDPDTGTREYPGTGDEYACELAEIAEAIRALAPPPASAEQPQPARIDPMQNPLRPTLAKLGPAGEHPAEEVLRKLACWLGVGGFNAPTVDADLFHRRIVGGIEELLKEQKAAPAEPSDEPPFDLVDRCAQRIASWEDGCVWPDSWDSADVARMRLDAKRVLLEARAWWTSHAASATNGWTVIAPDGTRFEGQTPFSAASAATKHHGRSLYDPEKAAEFQALIADIRRESDDENARLVAEHGSLDCPACGGSGHIGDALAHPAPSDAVRDVLAERRRQVEVEGWTPEHDDQHAFEEMALAAACYANADPDDPPPPSWPWNASWWKPRDRRRNLIRAAAPTDAMVRAADEAIVRTLVEGGDLIAAARAAIDAALAAREGR